MTKQQRAIWLDNTNKNQKAIVIFILEYRKMLKKPSPNHPAYKTRPANQVFPEDIECVFPASGGKGAIFLGNLEAAQNPETLRKHNIGSLLTACKNVHIRHSKQHVPYALYIPGQDHQNYDLSMHFSTASDFIHQSRQETNILVHCMAGISRSATLVMAYLMKYLGMSLKEAFSTISSRRSKINPNPGFMRQLQKYEKQLPSKSTHLRHTYSMNQSENYRASSYYRPSSHKQSQYHHTTAKDRKSYDKYDKYNLGRETNEYLTKRYNPQYEQLYSMNLNYNYESHLKKYEQQGQKRLQDNRLNRTMEPFSNVSNYDPRSNIENLSKDLDERINKIKQKYYDRVSFDESRMENSKIDRIMPAGMLDLGRSRHILGRDSLRSSLYNMKSRPTTYQYGGYM